MIDRVWAGMKRAAQWYWSKFGLLVTCVLVLMIAGLWWFVRPGSDDTADLTRSLHIELPGSATDIHVDDPRAALQGSCSALEYLVPTGEWRDHVSQYFDKNSLEVTYDIGTSCGHTQIACARQYDLQPGSDSGYEASDQVDGKSRSLVIFPDCFAGQTKFAWSIGG